ncbi:MAG: type II toxin-antitoxin system HicA family toxin [Thermoleophilia bacterium]
MTQLPHASGREVVAALSKVGYEKDRQRGSHIVMRQVDHPHRRITVPDHREIVARRPDDESILSVITASEMLHGVHRAAQPHQRARRSHAQVWAELAQVGVLIGPHDLWLTATCLAHGLTMITANIREFARDPGLKEQRQLTGPSRQGHNL